MNNDNRGKEVPRAGDLATCGSDTCAKGRTISLLLIEADVEEACRLQTMLSQTAGLFVIKRVEQLQTALEYLAQGETDVVLADPSRHELDSSGLGRSICKRIVERAGGKIWAESDELGKGSTFFFTLKLAQQNIAQPERI